MLTEQQLAALAAELCILIREDDYAPLLRIVNVALATERQAIAAGLRNAAEVVRRDGGEELRAKTFEDAAYIVHH